MGEKTLKHFNQLAYQRRSSLKCKHFFANTYFYFLPTLCSSKPPSIQANPSNNNNAIKHPYNQSQQLLSTSVIDPEIFYPRVLQRPTSYHQTYSSTCQSQMWPFSISDVPWLFLGPFSVGTVKYLMRCVEETTVVSRALLYLTSAVRTLHLLQTLQQVSTFILLLCHDQISLTFLISLLNLEVQKELIEDFSPVSFNSHQ